MAKKSSKPLEGFENLLFTTKFGTPICDQIMIDAIKRIIDEIEKTKVVEIPKERVKTLAEEKSLFRKIKQFFNK